MHFFQRQQFAVKESRDVPPARGAHIHGEEYVVAAHGRQYIKLAMSLAKSDSMKAKARHRLALQREESLLLSR
jgi:hypothetical protein